MKTMMYVYMDPAAKLQQVTDACSKAAAAKCEAVCVPQWFVSTAAGALAGSGVKTATILGLPGGTTSSAAKYAEAKQAIANGASVIIVPVNMQLCASGSILAAKNDLVSSMAPAKKGAEAIALIDAENLSADKLEEVASMCIGAGVKSVLVANATADIMKKLAAGNIPCGSFGTKVYEGNAVSATPLV